MKKSRKFRSLNGLNHECKRIKETYLASDKRR
jgi:hypothetical protein